MQRTQLSWSFHAQALQQSLPRRESGEDTWLCGCAWQGCGDSVLPATPQGQSALNSSSTSRSSSHDPAPCHGTGLPISACTGEKAMFSWMAGNNKDVAHM
ncbi:organic solute transporter subunit alpha [Platysternon megacephalum]|uniref:Organic solute transporter subunit alpha n=1 Tax=Platysternon megacephalum TaxID=55544 RepID=A0A4D9E6C4_9SAUR|nr:organic solute transporter subunit alpha [Platysternon megacephalum]